MDRQHRRELKHDKFVDELGTLSTRARENQRLLVLLAVALVAVSVIGYGILLYRTNREQKAQDALAKAIETIDSPLQAASTPGTPSNPAAKFKTEAERSAAAEKQFRDLQATYPGSDAADVANLYLGRFDASHGNVPAARKKLQDFVDSHPKSILVGSARYSLYQLRLENGEATQVANELQGEIAKNDPPLPPDTILVLLAHAYDAQGNNEKSKETYRRITTEFPDSPYALEAQRRAGPVA